MPSTEEIRNLYSCIADADAFPPELMRNQDLFLNGLMKLSLKQSATFWKFLKVVHALGFALYYTGTSDDLGPRIGARTPDRSDADRVVFRLFFPAASDPAFSMNLGKIGKNTFGEIARAPLFAEQGLSAEMTAIVQQMESAVPGNPKIEAFLDDKAPYKHAAIKRTLAHLLPISHPVGGFAAGGPRFGLRKQWLETSV